MLSNTFQSGPCESKDTMSGKPCGGRVFLLRESSNDFGRREEYAKCLSCGVTYDLDELDRISDEAEKRAGVAA